MLPNSDHGLTLQMGEDSAFKFKLVTDVCSMSRRAIACPHRLHDNQMESHFVDWYRVLGVEEDDGIEVVRKRYRKLALQLHPDKNEHPKSESAFKLISEAYTCLSDHAKRRAFDLERAKNFCYYCEAVPQRTSKAPRRYDDSKQSIWNPSKWLRTCRNQQDIKDFSNRFKVEARVIENCLRVTAPLRKESLFFNPPHQIFQKEFPIFNPSDYVLQEYPHIRTKHFTVNVRTHGRTRSSVNHEQGSAQNEYPLFQVKSENNFTERNLFTFV